MSSGEQNPNNNQAGIIPAGTVGNNPQSTLNPNGTFSFFLYMMIIIYSIFSSTYEGWLR